MTDDPLDFLELALAALPEDPRSCTPTDLATLRASHEGLASHTARLLDEAAALEQRTRDLDGADLRRALRERARLAELEARYRLAERRLDEYTTAAFAANDIDLADLMVGGN